jgi:HSP20 family protein
MKRLSEQLDELLDDLWRGPRFAARASSFRPRVDIYSTEDPSELTIVVEVAGLEPGDLDLTLDGDLLTVFGRRDHVTADDRGSVSWYQAEISRGPFEWRVRLPANADPAGARAGYTNGLLTIVLPLASTAAPRAPVAIPVTSA